MSTKNIAVIGANASIADLLSFEARRRARENVALLKEDTPEPTAIDEKVFTINEYHKHAEREERRAKRMQRKADMHKHQYRSAVVTDEGNVSCLKWTCECGKTL